MAGTWMLDLDGGLDDWRIRLKIMGYGYWERGKKGLL